MTTAASTPPVEHDEVYTATISRKLDRFIYSSLALSASIFACSVVLFGFTSYWTDLAGFGLLLIHHFTILGHRWKLRKLRNAAHQPNPPTTQTSNLPIPISSRKFTIFAAWFISFVYTVALAISIMNVHYMVEGYFERWDPRFTSGVVELILLFFEVPLLVTIAFWCMRERRAILGVKETK